MAHSQPLAPLSVGNVVSAAATLYRSHLKAYLLISLRATLWTLLPIAGFLVIGVLAGIVGVIAGNSGNSAAGLLFALLLLVGFIGAIALWVIGFTRYLVNSAVISRLAFQELINQPETVKAARKAIMPRKWSFLSISFRIGLAISALYIGLIIALMILIFTSIWLLTTILGEGILAGLLVALIGIVAFIAGLFALMWLFSRWFIAEVPLAVESNLNGAMSMQRSWDLTQNHIFHVQGIAIIAFLITLPLISVTSYIPQIFLAFLEPYSALYWIVYTISLIFSLSGNLLVLPLWQTTKAVLYYDLRNRREGLNIRLREGE